VDFFYNAKSGKYHGPEDNERDVYKKDDEEE
jgi:hypothetical protein